MLTRGDLLSLDGRLMDRGYATSLLKRYDRSMIKAPKWRIKEWDYYLICNDFFALALTVADNSYMGLDSISLIDFEKKQQHTVTRMKPLTGGKLNLHSSSDAGVVRAQGKNYEITLRKEGDQRHLYGHMYDFGGERSALLFDVVLHDQNEDSMVIVTPFHNKPHHFYYNQKINCLPAQGRVIFNGLDYIFSPATSFGVLDWGRGVWTYRNTWYWASASGIVQGQRFGLNLGYGFGDTSAATENMLFYDGKAHKLQDVVFDIPRNGKGFDYEKPWEIKDNQGRLHLNFVPILDRAAKVSALVISTDQHQVFGRFNGNVTLDDGRTLQIKDLIGFAERVKNRY
ncbi:MAG: DUF2804 domain-containing protein [Clostridiales bacterium]|nr:DUF2804 domain-containing protein [Clostridiales bacterium]